MNKRKKIRGHKRIQRRIEKWIEQNKTIHVGDFLANQFNYVHVSFEPYFNISINNNNIAEPKSKTRNKIILGLEEIYDSWKIELDKLNQPYFLKIYLFEPRISKSQVICALGKDNINYYENIFRTIETKNTRSNLLNILAPDFKWKTHSDDNIYSEQELLFPEMYNQTVGDSHYCRKFLKKLKKKYTKIEAESCYGFEDDNKTDYFYYVPKGIVWIGGK
ncbi:hypothetical protein FEDK69T_31630 [Flavobacterium enshiense DK69]|uniref:hypothetical protein n=1 Tax=Flavobacterium enshiense TaxID=1341165 RepID=UPI0003C5B3F8|nr:hypothetical protein [Flavobacterium enshiense]ESU19491.1 hypothetical protein FEDK69T_31630 [Flavobacterium enshiense DK69]